MTVPNTPRILCGVVHHAVDDGGDARRTAVQRVLAGLRALPYDVDVRVYGTPASTVVELDVELDVELAETDPSEVAYATLESMLAEADDYDYLLCQEDDLLIDGDTVERMIRFATTSRVNEVLLPNRLEIGELDVAYCPDLTGTAWRGLRRRFEDLRLGVSSSPHSGLVFLSAEQAAYAARRAGLARRDRDPVGTVTSAAFAAIHEPFLLWRTRDVEAHRVQRLGHPPAGAPVHLRQPVKRQRLTGEGLAGSLDDLAIEAEEVTLRGWAADHGGAAVRPQRLELGGSVVPDVTFEPENRPDLAQAQVSAEAGFAARFRLTDLTPEQRTARRITVGLGSGGIVGAWPRRTAVQAAANPIVIPDDPHLPEATAKRLIELWSTARTYLEYGTGGTTLLCARLGGPKIYAVESDRAWLGALRDRLRQAGSEGRHVLLHADIGPTGAWGYPVQIPPGTASGDYALAVWRRLAEDGRTPEVVLVDGRFRVACFLATLLHADAGTRILFDDYLEREHYTAVEQVLAPSASHDRAVEFVVPSDLDREAAWRLLARYAGDVR